MAARETIVAKHLRTIYFPNMLFQEQPPVTPYQRQTEWLNIYRLNQKCVKYVNKIRVKRDLGLR